MHSPVSLAAIGLYAVCALTLAAARDCFLPNGTIPYDNGRQFYVPCGPDDGTHSSCCKPGDGCSTSGLCFGRAGYMYRGGCTDATWTSQNCAQHCQKVSIDGLSHLYPCPDNRGTFTNSWCCSDVDRTENGCCDTSRFNTSNPDELGHLMIGAGQSDPTQSSTTLATMSSATRSTLSSFQTLSSTILSPQTPSTTNAISSSTSATAQPRSHSTTSHINTVAIGAGLGVPLGLLLVSGLAWLLRRERQYRRLLEQKVHDMQASFQAQRSFHHDDKMERKAGDLQPSELHDSDRPPELHSQPTVELGDHL